MEALIEYLATEQQWPVCIVLYAIGLFITIKIPKSKRRK